ncbi:MAG TPA: ACP S-malonyltransferase [Acidimicrobiales bacterium]|nr:ACP S-malonyltransferase [Acidimicrobiales bacterium]
MPAFTFPGQGSQRPGMGRPWVDHPSWEVVEEASELAERDLSRLLLEAEQDELTLTANAQLATFVLSLVILDAVERVGIEPSICAGHSLGEYTALVASGALAFEDGVRLVAERGDAMHHAAEEHPGTMAAVLGAEDDAVEVACQRAEGEVWVANFNAPGQVVIAGTSESVETAGTLAKELGARKVMSMPVAGAFHTPLMAPARSRLRKALADTTFQPPGTPVVANVDARVHAEADQWQSLLSAQLCSPVRWRQSLATLSADGAEHFVELGPGGVLSGLARRTLPGATVLAVQKPEDVDELVAVLAGLDSASPAGTGDKSAHGERLSTGVRLVVSPAGGVFEPADLAVPAPGAGLRGESPGGEAPGAAVEVGALLGKVGDVEVRTPFGGRVAAFLTIPGERVVAGQPVAWLHVERAPA